MYASTQNKAASAAASFAIVLALTLTLVFGLRVDVVARHAGAIVSVLLSSEPPPKPKPPPPPKPRPVEAKTSAARGDPSPRNLRNQATPVFAPKLPPLILPPPIAAAPLPAQGSAAQTGASDRAGPGQGAGGIGNGNGGGGTGGDGDGGPAVGPRQTKGKLSFKDLPADLLEPGSEVRVGVRYTVNIDGTVSNCRADEPSGIPQVDSLACRLIEERFRFKPAQDRNGRPVRATIVEAHTWFVRDDEHGPRG